MSAGRIQWDAEYLKQCFADEVELASVHKAFCGRTYTAPLDCGRLSSLQPGVPVGRGFDTRNFRTTTAWAPPFRRRSWNGAGQLVSEFGLSIRQDVQEGSVSVGTGNRRRDVTEAFADHPDEDAAIWAAIVRAAIQLCAETREAA